MKNDTAYQDGDSLLIVAVIFVVFSVLFCVGSIVTTRYEYPSVDIPLATLSDESQTSGRFALGSGYIATEPIFVFYHGTDATGFKLATRYSRNSTIYRDTDVDPYMRDTQKCIYYFGRMATGGCEWYSSEFHVPRNTIVDDKKNYNLDGAL